MKAKLALIIISFYSCSVAAGLFNVAEYTGNGELKSTFWGGTPYFECEYVDKDGKLYIKKYELPEDMPPRNFSCPQYLDIPWWK